MKNKINWILISNIAVIGALIVITIGFYVVMNNLNKIEKRLQKLELNYSLIEQDFNELYDIDPKIRKIE